MNTYKITSSVTAQKTDPESVKTAAARAVYEALLKYISEKPAEKPNAA